MRAHGWRSGLFVTGRKICPRFHVGSTSVCLTIKENILNKCICLNYLCVTVSIYFTGVYIDAYTQPHFVEQIKILLVLSDELLWSPFGERVSESAQGIFLKCYPLFLVLCC